MLAQNNMNRLDDLLYAKVCAYLPLVNCNGDDIRNLKLTSTSIAEMVKKNVKIEQHRVVSFCKRKSRVKWSSDALCLTCHKINNEDYQQLLQIRNQLSLGFTRDKYLAAPFYDKDKCGIYIHRKTQSELETFLVKLRKVTKNVVITRNFCCEGKGVEIDVS